MKYLYEPASPVYDESLYILLLEKLLAQPSLSEKEKQDFGFDLRMAKKNRVGEVAADFSFLTRAGGRSTLLKTEGEYILLFLGDPDCDYCNDTKDELLSMTAFCNLVESGRLKVLYVCVEGKSDVWDETPAPQKWIDACDDCSEIHGRLLYDIPGLPVLYLLDSSHRVLLKNTSPAAVEAFLKNK